MAGKPTLAQLWRFIGNPNAYALQAEDGSWRPAVSRTKERLPVTAGVLRGHLAHEYTVGTYVGHKNGEGETVARTLCFDVDNGQLSDAESIMKALEELGFPASVMGIEASGRKGYHVWLLLQDYRPNRELRRVGRAAVALAGITCEVFPKQDEVRDLGNLVKLPGGIHQVSKHENNFLGPVPRPLPSVLWERVLQELPEEQQARSSSGAEAIRFPCMHAIQTLPIEEGSRNIQLFHLATMLRRGGVADEFVASIITELAARCSPPLPSTEVDALLESSRHSGPICAQLPEERQCGEFCVKHRAPGLYTRPGQLRHAAPGENVVLTVAGRRGSTVELEHADAQRARAILWDGAGSYASPDTRRR